MRRMSAGEGGAVVRARYRQLALTLAMTRLTPAAILLLAICPSRPARAQPVPQQVFAVRVAGAVSIAPEHRVLRQFG